MSANISMHRSSSGAPISMIVVEACVRLSETYQLEQGAPISMIGVEARVQFSKTYQ